MSKNIFIYLAKYNNINSIDKSLFTTYRLNKKDPYSIINIKTESLLMLALRDYLGNKYIKPVIKTNNHGKPYFTNLDLYFNISHTSDYIVVALSQAEVGIDIEKISNKRLKIARKVFSSERYESNKNDINALIKAWTIKEAFIKYKGLSVLINLREIRYNNNIITSKYGNAHYFLDKIKDHYLSVVSKEQSIIKLKVING